MSIHLLDMAELAYIFLFVVFLDGAESKGYVSNESTLDTSYRSDVRNIWLNTTLLSCSGARRKSNFCSLWVYCDAGECKCGEIALQTLQCNVHKNSTLSNFNCITYNEKEGLIEVGSCIYSVDNDLKERMINLPYTILPREISELNDFMCSETLNRGGTLCGGCKEGYYPLVYSYDSRCIQCPNGKANWWKFALVAFAPLTLLYFVVMFFNINITSSHLHGFVFYSQVVFEPISIRCLLLDVKNYLTAFRCIAVLYGIWNLDFFRSIDLGICLETDSLLTRTLDLSVGIYPLVLMLLTLFLLQLHDRNFRPFVLIWRPFHSVFSFFRRNWDVRTSLIDAFATFFLLSNNKFLSVSIDLLVPVQVYQLNDTGHLTYSWRLYYDATVPYFGHRHLPYAILAIAVAILFVLLPMLLLLLYPFRWFQKFLNLFPVRWYILHTFVDSFQGCYKNGTEPGTRDCRWFSSVLLLTYYLLTLIGGVTENTTYFPLAVIVLVLVVILFITVQPYRSIVRHYTYINITFTLLIALLYCSVQGIMSADMSSSKMILPLTGIVCLSGLFPLLYISASTLYWVYGNKRFGLEIIGRLCNYRRGYDILQ